MFKKLKSMFTRNAQTAIEAAVVNVFPNTVEHRNEQLTAIGATLTPENLINILK